MYNRAKELMPQQGVNGDLVSVRAFMQAVNELHNVEWILLEIYYIGIIFI